jgi:hypothetical protein
VKEGGNEMHYEQTIRGQIAAERIERIADACTKANMQRRDRRRARRYLPLAAGLELADRARRWAARPQIQA